ncbi:MAG: hypothetical protein ACT4PT_09455, partial [Methanobacteriota archaeon]
GRAELLEVLKARLLSYVFDEHEAEHRFDELVSEIAAGRLDPYSAADRVLEAVGRRKGDRKERGPE